MSFDNWIGELEVRHLADLQFNEVSRALRALSSAYVERRSRLAEGAALAGAGKRAAFALFYGPLHFLTVREIVRGVGADQGSATTLLDLGCGTGTSGSAWASSCSILPSITGVDRSDWALREAMQTYRAFGARARVRRDDAARAAAQHAAQRKGGAVLAAYTVNELEDRSRAALLAALLAHVRDGGSVLIVEPLARSIAPWWNAWRAEFEPLGGRSDEWRIRTELPAIVAKLDRAAGLNHRELTARSLYASGASSRRS